MTAIRKAAERGHFNHGWLDTWHSFSFASYHDPAHMGFRALRVINDDTIAAGGGFGEHGHRDMEIITYVISGALSHQDSMGNKRTIRAGEVQAMSAGTGIMHSEFNASDKEPVHLLQIWIIPDAKGITPAYAEWTAQAKPNAWTLLVSKDGAEGSAIIHQDARLLLAKLEKETVLEVPVQAGRHGWLQVAVGALKLGDKQLLAGDGVSFAGGNVTRLGAAAGTTLLLFDLA